MTANILAELKDFFGEGVTSDKEDPFEEKEAKDIEEEKEEEKEEKEEKNAEEKAEESLAASKTIPA